MRPNTRSDAVTIAGISLTVLLALTIGSLLLGPVLSSNGLPAGAESRNDSALVPAVEDIPEGGFGENVELVAHEPLLDDHQYVGNESYGIARGSNGEITATGDCVYVGSMIGHQPPLIVDVSDPTAPEVVGPVPDAVPGVGNGIEGIEASGDVLVIDHRDAMGGLAFEVPEGLPQHGLSVWNVSDCREPELVARHDAGDLETHALRLWRDPQNPDRLLGVQTYLDTPNLQVIDLTGCPAPAACDPEVVAEWSLENQTGLSGATHEAIASTDGNRLYVAQADVGFLLLDSSNLLASLRGESDCDPSTPDDSAGEGHCLSIADPDVADSLERQPAFESGFPHTLAKVPDRPYFIATGESSGPDWGESAADERLGKCPGASLRIHGLAGNASAGDGTDADGPESVAGPLDPEPVGTFRLPEQRQGDCQGAGWERGAVPSPGWLSPHFPATFPDVAFVTYYGGGFRAVDISDPADPEEVGHFINDPVEEVRWAYHGTAVREVTNDEGRTVSVPAPNRTHPFAFSYPIVVDGYLVYSDSQSGLYVLEYTGPHADQIPDEGTCLPANPGAVDPGYEPCPPYGETDWGTPAGARASDDG